MKQGKKLLSVDGQECEHSYNDVMLEVSGIMHKKTDEIYWYVRVENFGWNKASGYSYITASMGRHFMRQILPKCECAWNMFNYGKGVMIQNFHHDSNSGDEKYYCVPISKRTFDNESYKGSV